MRGGLNPELVGWPEFWLRIAVTVAVVAVLMLALATIVKLVLTVVDAVSWIARKVRRE